MYSYSDSMSPFSSQLLEDLTTISSVSNEIVQSTSAYVCNDKSVDQSLEACTAPSLHLLDSEDIRRELLDRNVSLEHAESLSQVYYGSLKRIKRHIQSAFSETWTRISSLPRHDLMMPLDKLAEQLADTYEAYYATKAAIWRKEIFKTAVSCLSVFTPDCRITPDPLKRQTTSFNFCFTPTLESFYDENPAPSRAQKQTLAEQSGMSYKQISVWFQNRRMRTRRGKRSPTCYRRELNKKLKEPVPVYFARQNTYDSEEEGGEIYWPSKKKSHSRPWHGTNVTESSSTTSIPPSKYPPSDPFDFNPPAYAFPAIYPPRCSEDPFPCRYGDTSFCAAKPVLREHVRRRQTLASRDFDVNSLTISLRSLTIDDNGNNDSTTAIQSAHSCGRNSMLLPNVIRPPRAPLDSLVRLNHQCCPSPVPFSTNIHIRTGQDSLDYTPTSEFDHANNLHGSIIKNYPYYSLCSDSEEPLPSLSYSPTASTAVSDEWFSPGSPISLTSESERNSLSPTPVSGNFLSLAIFPVSPT